MAEVIKTIIDVDINTGNSAAQLKALQQQANAFFLSLNKNNATAGAASKAFASDLIDAINNSKVFTAEQVKMRTAAGALDNTLSKGQATLGQYFSARYLKNSTMFAESLELARNKASMLQTQFVATGAAANGFQSAIAIRPLSAFASQAVVASQKTQILAQMFRQGTTQLINFGKNVQWAGRQLMVGFTVPLTIFGGIASKAFRDIEKEAVNFRKVYGDIFTTDEEIEKQLGNIKELASEFTKYGIAVKDTMELAAIGAQAGKTGAELQQATIQATRLATLGDLDRQESMRTTIALQTAFKMSNEELANSINFLNMVENSSVLSLQDLAESIPRVAPVIVGLGGSVKEMAVFLTAMREGGVNAAEAANGLKSSLGRLISPTKQARDMANDFGISLERIVEVNEGNVLGMVISLSQAMEQLTNLQKQQLLSAVFGKFQFARMGALFENITKEGSQAQRIIEMMDMSIEDMAATAEKELKAIEESAGTQLVAAMEKFRLAIAPIGELFVKLAIPVINFFTSIIEKFNALPDFQKKFAAFAAIITGVVIPAGTMFFGLLMNLTGTLAKLFQFMGSFGKGFLRGGILGAIQNVTQSTRFLSNAEIEASLAAKQLGAATETTNIALRKHAASVMGTTGAVDYLAKSYTILIGKMLEAAAIAPLSLGTGRTAISSIKSPGAFVQRRNLGGPIFMADGRRVPGTGNTDTVPAMLTPGEFVVNKEATQKNFSLLEAINASGQRLNSGGTVRDASPQEITALIKKDPISDQIRRELSISQNRGIDQAIKKQEKLNVVKNRKQIDKLSQGAIKEIAKYRINGNQILEGSAAYKRLVTHPDGGFRNVKEIQSILRRATSLGVLARAATPSLNRGTTFAHVQGNVLDARSPAGRAAFTSMFGVIEQLYASKAVSPSGKPLISAQQMEAWRQGFRSEWKGWRAVGNMGFDVSRSINNNLNAGNQNVSQLINDLDKRFNSNRNPYATMFSKIKMDKELSNEISKKLHQRVIADLSNLSKTTPIVGDKTIYPILEKAVTETISSSINDEKIKKKMISNLYAASEVRTGPIQDSAFGKAQPQGTKYGVQSKLVAAGRFGPLDLLLKGLFLRRNKGGSIPLNRGNIVPGTGNTDTVPAMLTPGEFVINKEATRKNYELLTAINSGKDTLFAMKGIGVEPLPGQTILPQVTSGSPSQVAGSMSMSQKMSAGLSKNPMLGAGLMSAAFLPMMAGPQLQQSTNEMTKKIGEFITTLSPIIFLLAAFPQILGKMLTVGGGFAAGAALLAFTIYKVNDEFKKMRKAGADLVKATYGSAEASKAFAEVFNKQTASQRLAQAQASAAGGEIGEEAQTTAGQFINTEAGERLIEDMKKVAAAGGDIVESLRNQLTRQVVAGIITPEEARAIAAEVGNALGNQMVSVNVSAQLTRLLGPTGQNLLNDSASIIAEISPKVDERVIKAQAKAIYEETTGIGKGSFFGTLGGFFDNDAAEQYKISLGAVAQIAIESGNIEKEMRSSIELAFRNNIISAEQYKQKLIEIENIGPAKANTDAFLKFSGADQIISQLEEARQDPEALKTGRMAGKGFSIVTPSEVQKLESQLKETLEPLEGAFDQQIKGMFTEGMGDAGEGMFNELSNKIDSLTQGDALAGLQFKQLASSGQVGLETLLNLTVMTDEELDNISNNLEKSGTDLGEYFSKLNRIPNVQTKQALIEILTKENAEPVDLDKVFDDVAAIESLPTDLKLALNIDMTNLNELDRVAKTVPELQEKYKEVSDFIKKTNKDISNEKVQMDIIAQFTGLDNPFIKKVMDMIGKDFDPIKLPILISAMADPATLALLEQAMGAGGAPGSMQQFARDQARQLLGPLFDLLKGMKSEDFSPTDGGDGGQKELSALEKFRQSYKETMLQAKQFYQAIKMGKDGLDMEGASLLASNGLLGINAKEREKVIRQIQRQQNVQAALAFLQKSAEERAIEEIQRQQQRIQQNINSAEKRLRDLQRSTEMDQRQISLRQRGLELLSRAEDRVNEQYNKRIEALDKVSQLNERIAQQNQDRISLASALTTGDIAAAAQAANRMQANFAQNQLQDTRSAMDAQREAELEALTIRVNGQYFTRKQLEEQILAIEDKIYERNLQMIPVQDELYRYQEQMRLESEKIDVLQMQIKQKEMEMVQEGLKIIQGFGKKNKKAKAFKDEIRGAYNNAVDLHNKLAQGATKVIQVVYQYSNVEVPPKKTSNAFGGPIAGFAMGGRVNYKGSREAPPALMMGGGKVKKYAVGNVVPGLGNTDRVPALLTPGEFVVRKSVASKNMDMLKALNSDVFPGMSGFDANAFTNPGLSPIIDTDSITNVTNANSANTNPTVYNEYTVNVNVPNTDASPDQIANVVMAKIQRGMNRNVRGVKL